MKTHNEVFFDIETQRLFSDVENEDPTKLGVSIVSIYQREIDENLKEVGGEIKSFWEDELEKIWEIFSKADRIIGFNSIGFDVPVLKPYAPTYFSKLPHFDILTKFKEITSHRISLNSLAKATLGRNKTDSGLNAVTYWHNHDEKSLSKLKKYCEEDVLITKDIYHYGLTKKELVYFDKWNTERKISVDFSYPYELTSVKQQGLF